jgi:hypothetical protein
MQSDPGSGKKIFRIPDTGIKKGLDPGSLIRVRYTGMIPVFYAKYLLISSSMNTLKFLLSYTLSTSRRFFDMKTKFSLCFLYSKYVRPLILAIKTKKSMVLICKYLFFLN